ncbi:MAG: YraN family protein [Actinomycetota bacterium]|nr:YraN family protein [Actinomycetota bacterium]
MQLGVLGEAAALQRYRSRGFDLVARNWRCRAGEIDLILRRAGLLVFCEVKTRRSSGLGGGYEAVTHTKQRKLRQLAEMFLREHRPGADAVRFDVASVHVSAGGRESVELFEDAF